MKTATTTRKTGSFLAYGAILLWCLPLSIHAADLDARLQWSQRVELGTPVSGKIDRVLVDVGSHVRKGDTLLQLDTRGFRAELQQAQGELVRAREKRDEAKRELDRGQELFERTVISPHELQLVKIDYASADAMLREAEAKLQLAKLNLEYSVIQAPFRGVVIQRDAEPGQTVVSRLQATPLIVLANDEHMLARADVSLDLLGTHRVGDSASVRIEGKELSGTIKRIGMEPVANAQPGTYSLEVEFSVPENMPLRSGQPATIILQ